MIEVNVKVGTIEEAETQADIVRPGLFPTQLFITALLGINPRFIVVIGPSGHKCEVVVVGYFRVSGSSRTECNLCTCQPFDVFQKKFVFDIPHEAQ